MDVGGKVVVVTGGAHGIGRALAERFHREGAKIVVVADLDLTAAQVVASGIGGVAVRCDVAVEADTKALVADIEKRFGAIGLFCSNAGIATFDPLPPAPAGVASSPNDAWLRSFQVNVMAHVYAARALVPLYVARGGGYFLQTVSAAGLLSQIGGAVYATTKHAAIGFAESLAITHKGQGIKVSVLCPQGVDTPMLRSLPAGSQNVDGVLSAETVAGDVVAGLAKETFLILPHPQVLDYMRKKTEDYDRWIGGMAKLKRTLDAGALDGSVEAKKPT